MELLQLVFANGESSLSVRSFNVVEDINELFQIEIVARAPSADIDFENLIGQKVQFRMASATSTSQPWRTWEGLCERCEQVRAQPGGLSTYELTIVPRLWLLSKRRNHRLFQHVSVVEIIKSFMREWDIDHEIELGDTVFPPLELRSQYGESDYHFLARMLQEAGISFFFRQDEARGSILVFSHRPHEAKPRPGLLSFVDDPTNAPPGGVEYCTQLRVKREMRPGRVVLRDFDFRKPRFELFADARVDAGAEEQMEQYHYVPGQFKTEGHAQSDTPTADDLGVARADQTAGTDLATRILQSERGRRRAVSFHTNAFDVAPGTISSVTGHPRTELAPTSKLLAVGFELSGEVSTPEKWSASVKCLFADTPFQPLMSLVKPRINGVQSAIVVGPTEETVYTDEFGRVRVQFHWDRQGQFNPKSSCWMRVSQGWAGPGYGLFNLPRVGHEVLVGFVDGDPDQPIITGRVFNGAQRVPYPLPGSKMMSGWKTDSNSNIILFDDTPGKELFYDQAERNRLGIVKQHEAYITGGRRTTWIGTTEKTLVRTSATRVALGNHKILAGISNKLVGAVSFKAHAGFGATIKAGRKFEAAVTPVLPFITALMDVDDAKISIIKKLPGGKAPDLQQMLPYYAGGPQPMQEKVNMPPNMSQDEVQEELKKTLAIVGNAVVQFTPEEVEEMAEANDLDHAVDSMLRALKDKGGDQAVTALADSQQLAKHLKMLSAASNQGEKMEVSASKKPAPAKAAAAKQGDEEQQTGMFEKLLITILEMVLPKTKITITHQKIKIETEKASIELDDDNIKLKAKGDIEIKADGKVSISGSCVNIDPSPCKCG